MPRGMFMGPPHGKRKRKLEDKRACHVSEPCHFFSFDWDRHRKMWDASNDHWLALMVSMWEREIRMLSIEKSSLHNP